MIIITFPSFFTPSLGAGPSLESEWEQVSSRLLDASQGFARSHNVVVWMVPIVIFYFSRSLSKHLGTFLSTPITIGITVIRFKYHSVVRQDSKALYSAGSLFLLDYHSVWSSGCDSVIRLCFKILENFFKAGFCFVHIPFVCIVKFQFFAQFPLDHLSNTVVSSLIFYLHYFATLIYNAINHQVSITT